ncbi:MAG: DUF523 domain-containing protein [Clostridia bacterium]|nr:DUF523 domain-containing protein [Clostridia bacterium]
MIIVSACLAGISCRYNGEGSLDGEIRKLLQEGRAIPLCPEQLGGCPTPRRKAEIYKGTGGDVLDGKCIIVDEKGEDVTTRFVRGAEEVLKIAKIVGADKAFLKANSPSCGCGQIYDGTFSGNLTIGNGVTAELLIRNGIIVKSESEIGNK